MKNNLKYVLYTHSEYFDILKINLEFSKNLDKILFINKNHNISLDLISDFEKIIYYDDSLPYAERIFTCLNQIENEFILFSHDIDIPLSFDVEKLNGLIEFMNKNDIDRVDLQQDVPSFTDVNKQQSKKNLKYDELILIKNENPNTYIYNVNPSIWKKTSFIEIMNIYKKESYRSIELSSIQTFCTQYNIFKCHHNNSVRLGWFFVTPIFKYLHITHNGHLLPENQKSNTLDNDTNMIYQKIIDEFNLKNQKRPFSPSLF